MKLYISKEMLTDLTEFIENQKLAERELFLLKSQQKARRDDSLMLTQKIERAFKIAEGYVTPMGATEREVGFYQMKREEALKDVGEMEQLIHDNEKTLEELPQKIKAKELEVNLGKSYLAGFMAVDVEPLTLTPPRQF